MDDELKDVIKEVCATYAVNMYQASGLSPARSQEEMNQAKLNVKAHIQVEERTEEEWGEEHIRVNFPMMEIIKVPPFYGMIISVVMTERFAKICNDFFLQSPFLKGKKFYYTY